MKFAYTFIAILFVASFTITCSSNVNPNCFIHYTPDSLDEKTTRLRDVLMSGIALPKDNAQIEEAFNRYASLSYDEYGGKVPAFSPDFNLDTIVDRHGWKTMRLNRRDETSEFNIMYIHGGAFFMSFTSSHRKFCEAMLKRFHATIYMPLYPLAPAHRVIDGTDMIIDAYRNMLEDGKPVYVVGDSAGGNLALCLCLRLKKMGIKLPEAVFPISPIVDLSYGNSKMKKVAKTDPLMNMGWANVCHHWMEDGMSSKDPMVSPIYGDLKGMPRTLFFIGSDDIFGPDEMLMYEKMKDKGVEVGVLYGRSLWHTAPNYQIPVREQYLEEMAEFIGNSSLQNGN